MPIITILAWAWLLLMLIGVACYSIDAAVGILFFVVTLVAINEVTS
jgi:hypothetical protein